MRGKFLTVITSLLLIYSLMVSGFLWLLTHQPPVYTISTVSPAFIPTDASTRYMTALRSADSTGLCRQEDLEAQQETMQECIQGWDTALANLRAIPPDNRNFAVHQATIKMGPDYYLDAWDAYDTTGKFVITVVFVVLDGKIEQLL